MASIDSFGAGAQPGNDGVIDVIGNQDLMCGELQALRKAGCDYLYSVYGQSSLCKAIVLRVLWCRSKMSTCLWQSSRQLPEGEVVR